MKDLKKYYQRLFWLMVLELSFAAIVFYMLLKFIPK